MRATAEEESRPEVGSSNIIMDGFVSSSVPMLTRFLSPLFFFLWYEFFLDHVA